MLLKRTSRRTLPLLAKVIKSRPPVKRRLTPSYHLFQLHSRSIRLHKLMNTATRLPSKATPRGRLSRALSRFHTVDKPHTPSKAIIIRLLTLKDLLLNCLANTLQSLPFPSSRISRRLPPRLPRPLAAITATIAAMAVNPTATYPLPVPRTRKNHPLCLLVRLARKARKTLVRSLAWLWLKALQPTRP